MADVFGGTGGLIVALLGSGGVAAIMTTTISGVFTRKKTHADTIQVATTTAREVLAEALQQSRADNAELRKEVKELRAENAELWRRVTALEKAGRSDEKASDAAP